MRIFNLFAGVIMILFSSALTSCSDPAKKAGEPVDLGLSVKWADHNIGAASPGEYGQYFAWGETESRDAFDEDGYAATVGWTDLGDISGDPQHDAASANWGGEWRMPTRDEFTELLEKCEWTPETRDGKRGCRVTGPNGNSIFLPCAGDMFDHPVQDDWRGLYWTSTPLNSKESVIANFTGDGWNNDGRTHFQKKHSGLTIRPVCD